MQDLWLLIRVQGQWCHEDAPRRLILANVEFVDFRKIVQLALYLGSTWHEEERHQVYLVFDRNLDFRRQHIAIEEKVISNDVRIPFHVLAVPFFFTTRAPNVLTIVHPGPHHLVVRRLQHVVHDVLVCSLSPQGTRNPWGCNPRQCTMKLTSVRALTC